MPEIKKILFPTSCSERSAKAFEYTLAVAKYFGASIDLLHVCEPNIGILVPSIMRHQLIQEQKSTAQIILQNWLEQFDTQDLQIHQEIELGYAKESIAIYANKQQDIDLVVMGAKDNHSFTKILWGTIISKTIDGVDAPVLVVPKGIVFQDIKNVLYLTPVLENWRKIYPKVQKIAQGFKAKLFVAHLPEAPYQTLEGENHVVLENYESALHAFTYNKNLHLLVTLASVRNTFQKILKYSKAQKMAFETIIPLLVLKNR